MGAAAPRSCSDVKTHKSSKKTRAIPASIHERQRSPAAEDASLNLIRAAVTGNTKAAMAAIVSHGDPNYRDADGLTVLMVAVAGGQLDVVRLLVTSNADVNAARESGGLQALSFAAARGELEIIRLLLQWKADVNPKLRRPVLHRRARAPCPFPLSRAAGAGHVEACMLLMQHEADPNASDCQGITAVMEAVECRHIEAAHALLKCGASATLLDQNCRSVLCRAVDVMIALHPQTRAPCSIRNPLTGTLTEFDYWRELCNIIVERDGDVNSVDKIGETLLVRAVRRWRNDIAVVLLDLKAEPCLPLACLDGGAVLLQAIYDQQHEICQTLVSRAASVNQRTSLGLSPLCIAISKADEDLSFFLLQNGAKYDDWDPRTGETLLVKAATKGMVRLYTYLRPHAQVGSLPGFSRHDAHDDGSASEATGSEAGDKNDRDSAGRRFLDFHDCS